MVSIPNSCSRCRRTAARHPGSRKSAVESGASLHSTIRRAREGCTSDRENTAPPPRRGHRPAADKYVATDWHGPWGAVLAIRGGGFTSPRGHSWTRVGGEWSKRLL